MFTLLFARPDLSPNKRHSFLPPLSECVVYEENIRAEGPQVGFKSVIRRLDSIKKLGVNVLWLMPVTPVGKLNSAGDLGSPYAFASFESINPEFGTEHDFRELISTAHRKGMAVIIDWVANHSAWDNPWISTHPDWYQHDRQGKIVWPPGTHWKDVAQLDYKNRDVWQAMTGAMQSWVDRYDIDGFRFDSVEYVPNPFWKEAVESLRKHSNKPLLMLAEGFRPDLYEADFDLTYSWPFYDQLVGIFQGQKASRLAQVVRMESVGVPRTKERLRFATNHDKYAWDGTPLETFKSEAAVRAAFAISVLCGGVPLIYSGQEVNWPRRIPIFSHSSIDWSTNPAMRSWITTVLAIRNQFPVMKRGAVSDLSSEDAVVLHRTLGDVESLIIVNVRDRSLRVSIPLELAGQWRDEISKTKVSLDSSLSSQPYSVTILLRKMPRQ
jgi:1,4-alpha-glucan branching enzyme